MKQVLIFSHQEEVTTSEVIDFLMMARKPFTRVNGEDAVQGLRYQMTDEGLTLSFVVNGKRIALDEIDACWVRKRGLQINDQLGETPTLNEDVLGILKQEMVSLRNHIHQILEDPTLVANPVDSFAKAKYCNKLEMLYQAKKHGFAVPDTLVTTEKEAVQRFFAQHQGAVITKGINTAIAISEHATGTCQVTPEDIEGLASTFFPTLWQAQIKKRYELRIFYLENKFYSTAIFSQLDTQTSVDFRNYNNEVPNRVVPFQLPSTVAKKLQKLIDYFGYDSCSVDFIVDQSGNFVFLEINPVGQFGMVSEPCNYYLEKKVAAALIGQPSEKA